eukprot:gene15948-17551_t
MFCYFGIKSWRPKSRKHSDKSSRRLELRERRKRNISEPIPITKSSAAVERLLRFRDNNNVFLLADGGSSISNSPCHHGFSRLYSSETSSVTTGCFPNVDVDEIDDSVFVDSITERLGSIAQANEFHLPPKPPRMKQSREFICQNSTCRKSEVLLGKFQVLFKSCSFCFTHYCSAKCQNECRREHRKVCFYGNIDHNLQQIQRILKESNASYYFSKLAYDGYIFKGRGCLFMIFSSPSAMDEFIEHKIAGMKFKPSYSASTDVIKRCVSNKYRKTLLETIYTYEPATQFVVNIAVVVGHRAPNNPVPRRREVTVRKIIIVDIHPDFAAREKAMCMLKECREFQTINSHIIINRENIRRKSI